MEWVWVRGYGMRSEEWVRDNRPEDLLRYFPNYIAKQPAPPPAAQEAFRNHMEAIRNA